MAIQATIFQMKTPLFYNKLLCLVFIKFGPVFIIKNEDGLILITKKFKTDPIFSKLVLLWNYYSCNEF